MPHAVFYALLIPGGDFIIRVIEKSDPAIPSDYSLENATAYHSLFLGNYGTDIEEILNQQKTLKDGTKATEGLLEFRSSGTTKTKYHVFTTARENKWINITIGVISKIYDDDCKNIIESFELI